MDISELSSEYEVRKLTEDDGDRISEKGTEVSYNLEFRGCE